MNEKKLATQAYLFYRRIEHLARISALSKEQEIQLNNIVNRAFKRYLRRKNAYEHFIDY
ncbi:MAG: hypothetical protein QX198_02340 [Methylococcaceae bacterium]